MKQKPRQGYAAKHDSADLDADLARALESVQESDGVSCKKAHEVARQLERTPVEAGRALDLQNRPIIRCQLGLFGFTPRKRIVKPASNVAPDLADAIRAARVNGRLPCRIAWEIADRRDLKRLEVANVCQALGIKISECQLGAF